MARAAARTLGVRVVLTGSEGEGGLVAEVAAGAGATAVPLLGTSLLDLAALLAGAEALMSGDTGPLHLAAALDRPACPWVWAVRRGMFARTHPVALRPAGR